MVATSRPNSACKVSASASIADLATAYRPSGVGGTVSSSGPGADWRNTPLELIRALEPDVIVKGGDYKAENIVGAKEVMQRGGEVKIVPFVQGYSTTALIETIQKL